MMEKILVGREAVDAYRDAHSKLYVAGWHKGIPEEHTPLLHIMLDKFKEQGFNSIQEFFNASNLFNIQELGLEGKELTDLDREALEGMWH